MVPSAWHSLGAFPPHRVGGSRTAPPAQGRSWAITCLLGIPCPLLGILLLPPQMAGEDGATATGVSPAPGMARQSRGQMGKRCTGAAGCCQVPAHPDAGTLGWPSTRARLQKGLSPVCVVLRAEPSYVLAGLGVLGHGPTALSHRVSAAAGSHRPGAGMPGRWPCVCPRHGGEQAGSAVLLGTEPPAPPAPPGPRASCEEGGTRRGRQ